MNKFVSISCFDDIDVHVIYEDGSVEKFYYDWEKGFDEEFISELTEGMEMVTPDSGVNTVVYSGFTLEEYERYMKLERCKEKPGVRGVVKRFGLNIDCIMAIRMIIRIDPEFFKRKENEK